MEEQHSNLFKTIVSLWDQHRGGPEFRHEVQCALNKVTEEDRVKFFRLNVTIAAWIMESSDHTQMSEKEFYQKVLEYNTNKHILPFLRKRHILSENSEDLGISIKTKVMELSKKKPFIMQEVWAVIEKISNRKLGEAVSDIINSRSHHQPSIFSLLKETVNKYVTFAA